MKLAFIGGGSPRILPIMRSLLRQRELWTQGEVRLIDRLPERAGVIKTLLEQCPEIAGTGCRVTATDQLEAGLAGVDALYVTMALEQEPSRIQAQRCAEYFQLWHSDMLSVNGAFLAARGGAAILHFARVMERCCPEALMLIFANPVAVFSAMVNNHTRIKALGICAGFRNCAYDLPRFFGTHGYHPEMAVESAGVNHFSFVVRGNWQGRPLQEALDTAIDATGASPVDTLPEEYFSGPTHRRCLQWMAHAYRHSGAMLFSSEADGIVNLDYRSRNLFGETPSERAVSIPRIAAAAGREQEKRFAVLAGLAAHPEPEIWQRNPSPVAPDTTDPANEILPALAGRQPFRIAASAPNGNAIPGLPERVVLEYSMELLGRQWQPLPELTLPAAWQGLITGYACHQTLLADALATRDPVLWRQALDCFPGMTFHPQRHACFQALAEIYTDLPEALRAACRHPPACL